MEMPKHLIGACDPVVWQTLADRGYFDPQLEAAMEKYLAEKKETDNGEA